MDTDPRKGKPRFEEREPLAVILEGHGPAQRVPQNQHEARIQGAYYSALKHYLRTGDQVYADRIASFEGETIGGDVLETDLEVLAEYALADEIPDGPYDR